MKHLWMIIGCILPLLLIFLAPALGLSSQVSMFIFIVFMFACHLLMPMLHGSHDHKQQNSETTKSEKKHGHH
ncbi:hypothetical protein [Sphingobacterium spiritivorum]|uniref:hypothetical protein n=1 Tax=Sphingobacterium spiritivorum TaxID=258 RepID=UPI000E0F3B84